LERVGAFHSQVSSKADLGAGAGAVLFGEEHVVVLAAVEGRVEVDEVDGFVLEVLAQGFEILAVNKAGFSPLREDSNGDWVLSSLCSWRRCLEASVAPRFSEPQPLQPDVLRHAARLNRPAEGSHSDCGAAAGAP